MCFYCEKESGNTLDHFLPQSIGGKDEEWNLVAACYKCNQEKGCKAPEEKFIEKWINLFSPPEEAVDKLRRIIRNT